MADTRRVGARIRSRLLTAAGAAALLVLALASGASFRLDAFLYDAFGSEPPVPADPRIVLVEIDQASVDEIGRWPWSRRVHARLIERLSAAGVRGIALDVLLSEPALADPEGDALLARALSRSGNVVLPVYAAAGGLDGSAVELLPIREFANSAAALGHTDHDVDPDGASRGLYLHAGVGKAHWPALALAMRRLEHAGEVALDEMPQVQPDQPASNLWVRDQRVLLPAGGRPDAYPRVSYSDVLAGRVAQERLRGRWILVSPVVPGLGAGMAGADAPDAPDAPDAQVHYQLAALDALLHGRSVAPLSLSSQILLGCLLVSLPLLLTGLPHLRSLGRPLLLSAATALLLSWGLLRWGQAWFPPGPVLLVLALGAAAWAARRLKLVRQFDELDPVTGLASAWSFQETLQHELRSARRTGQPLSLLMIEVDQLARASEDADGAAATAMLRDLAGNLRSRARRPRDLAARLEGGRFAILLPETTAQSAAAIATTIHVDLANQAAAQGAHAHASRFTTSIGMHTAQGDESLSGSELLDTAVAARTRASQAGGNRTSGHFDDPADRR